MRTLALLLLLMNMAFFAWQQQLLPWLPWQPELLQPEPAQPYHSTLPKLVLLSERETATLPAPPPVEKPKDELLTKEELTAKIEPPPVVPSPVPSASEPEPPKPHAPEPNPPVIEEKTVAHSEAVPPAQTQDETVSFQKLAMSLISQGKIVFSSPPVQPVTVVNSPKVVEMSATPIQIPAAETSQKSEPLQKSEVAQKVTPPPSPVPETKPVAAPPVTTDPDEKNKTLLSVPSTKTNKTEVVCYQIGHFSQLGEAQAASNWFKKKQMIAAPQKSDTRLATTTWLYLPAARSLQSVQATQKRLKQLGVADTVMMNTPNGYIVSLGVYRDKSSVSERLQELRNKGFDNIKAEERYATETKYWLNVKIVAHSATLLSQFQKAFKGLQAKTMTCDDLR